MTNSAFPPAGQEPAEPTMPEAEARPSRDRRPLVVLVVVILVALGIIIPIVLSQSHGSSGPVATGPTTHTVIYKVEGTGGATGADITMQVPGGGTSQQEGVALPLRHDDGSPLSFQAPAGAFVYISAQNAHDSGTITCTIEVDGEELQTVTSSGAYVIATCSGTV